MTGERQITVLVVEDSLSDFQLVKEHLKEWTEFAIEVEQHLSRACSRLEQNQTDVVLLDLNLPDSVGLDTFLSLHRAFPEIPVVILTGDADEATATEAVRKGAQDYIPKSDCDGPALARSLRFAIERQRRKQVESQLRLTKEEFDAAREIQEKLLPATAPTLPGFEIAGACVPAAATGGDYFDYISMGSGGLAVVIADVSSHGFAPALIMAGTRRILRTLASIHSDIGDIMTIANRAITEDTREHHFVTMFFAYIDPARCMLEYVGAGHNAYLFDADGEVVQLESTGFPLGTIRDAVMTRGPSVSLHPGQLILMLTDGFQEAQSPSGKLFGLHGVLQIAREHRLCPAQEIIDVLFKAVTDFCNPSNHQDDVTAVVIKVTG